VNPRKRNNGGFTLAEVLVSSFILGTAFIAASWSLSATASTKAGYGSTEGLALLVGREMYELAESLPKAPSGTTGATDINDVVALDCLIGAQFSPPVMADGTVVTEMDEWTQNVALSIFSMGNLTTPTADDPALGMPADASKLYRLDVVIHKSGEEVGSYQWWISP
jgi:Tfp pilus assembly protein PilV